MPPILWRRGERATLQEMLVKYSHRVSTTGSIGGTIPQIYRDRLAGFPEDVIVHVSKLERDE